MMMLVQCADADDNDVPATECTDDDVEGQFSSRSSPVTPSKGTKPKKHYCHEHQQQNQIPITQGQGWVPGLGGH